MWRTLQVKVFEEFGDRHATRTQLFGPHHVVLTGLTVAMTVPAAEDWFRRNIKTY